MTAAFSIILILPMRKEVKHDLELVYNKVQNARKGLDLNTKPFPNWEYVPEDMQKRLIKLKQVILDKCNKDYVTIVQTVHRMMFTIFNSFINSKHYDAKDRHLLKLFME